MEEDFSQYNGEGTKLRKAQLRMLEILKEVDKICRKNNIPYWLEGGTLLGAVRHGGFIPWDDDLDICVERKNMRKLKKALQKELPEKYIYQDRFTDFNLPLLISKVRDTKSYVEEEYSSRLKNSGLFVDIIPVEKIISKKLKKRLDYIYGHCVRSIHNGHSSILDKILSYICFLPAICCIYLIRCITSFTNCKQIGHIYGWDSYNLVPEKDIFPLSEIDFEGYRFSCPANSHQYLTSLFNDYMQIPPKDKRAIHSACVDFYEE